MVVKKYKGKHLISSSNGKVSPHDMAENFIGYMR
jgi:hypothetical protein